jgi:outer membrane protein OmpA-like peptidoglycan-associated protein
MRTPLVLSLLSVSLMSIGAFNAQAADAKFYDPTNVGSKTGDTVGYELYRTIGCPGRALLDAPCPKPKDSDGDGVIDSKDKCPATPAGRKVNADGCELDGDGDGVVDGSDKCPTVFAKTADGCPPPPAPVAAPPKKLVLEGVNFDNDQATLRPEASAELDKSAATLKEWGEAKVEIGGYTDSNGTEEHNMKLSQSRAEAVRDYLIGKGIAAGRLTAKGYGEANPVGDNATDAGRAQNRRVELVPQQ